MEKHAKYSKYIAEILKRVKFDIGWEVHKQLMRVQLADVTLGTTCC